MRVGQDRGTRGGCAEPWAVHTVYERARAYGDEDGVGQVGEDNGESSRRPVRRAYTNDLKASRLGGRSDTRRHRRFDRFGLKTGESGTSCGGVQEGLTGLTSKPGGDKFYRHGPQNQGELEAIKVRAKGTWRYREVCVKAKRSREGCPSVAPTKR